MKIDWNQVEKTVKQHFKDTSVLSYNTVIYYFKHIIDSQSCLNCKHPKDFDSEICRFCDSSGSNWQPKENLEECSNCKHSNKSADSDECKSCWNGEFFSNYEPKEESLLKTHLIPEMSRKELEERLLEYEEEINRLEEKKY